MPTLARGPANREREKLIALFLQAETDIINEIGRLRSMGNVDYHAQAALDRIQRTLYSLENESWKYVPRMIEREFYVNHPEERRIPETAEKHAAGYAAAAALTAEELSVIDTLTANLMGKITEAGATAFSGLENVLLGRAEPDLFRTAGLEWTARMEAQGAGAYKTLPDFVEALRRDGVTCFVDRAGRRWSLHTYGAMVLRTTSRQASNLAVLTADPDHDLYQISSHDTSCPLCAPYEGRVYSKSGTDPDFPPLAAAFGKVDANGPDTLANTWLNIHPNCLVPGGTVLAEGVMAHSCREYDGPVVTLVTSKGNRITVTPNHPILTPEGFVPAGMLQENQEIIEATREYGLLIGETPDNINIPTAVEDVGHSVIQTCGGTTVRVKGSAIQFHGDGITDSEVDVVLPECFRVCEGDALRCKPVREERLPSAHCWRLSFLRKRTFFQIFNRALCAAHSVMSRFGFGLCVETVSVESEQAANISQGTATFRSDLRKSKPLLMQSQELLKFFRSGLHVSRRHIKELLSWFSGKEPAVHHGAFDGVFGYAEMFRHLRISDPLAAEGLQRLLRQNVLVVSNLIQVSTSEYHGKVYNLQTKYGFYTYNSIVTHNCLHVLLPWTAAGRTPEEIQAIKDFSNPEKNPFNRDPRTQEQIEAYRRKEQARRRWLNDYRQWERYRVTLGDKCPKTFNTFLRHKRAGDEKWKLWKLDYDRQLRLVKHPELALPGAAAATAADAKFTGYFFNPENQNGWSKGVAFSSRLGYNADNWNIMRAEILDAATKYPAVFKGDNAYGQRYEQLVILRGLKNKPANVLIGWQVNRDGTVHMTTAHMEEVK